MPTLADLYTTASRFTQTLDHIEHIAATTGLTPDIREIGDDASDGHIAVWKSWELGTDRTIKVLTYMDDVPTNVLALDASFEDEYSHEAADELVQALTAARALLTDLNSIQPAEMPVMAPESNTQPLS